MPFTNLHARWLLAAFLLMSAACSTGPPEASSPSYRLVGYAFGGNGLDLSPAAARMLTHINYAFANVRPDGTVVLESPRDSTRLARLVAFKKYNPDLKILLSVGGWSWSDYFSNAALTEASRERFARSAVALVKKHHLDGLDIDWEYPGQPGQDNIFRPEDEENFTRLLAATRAHLRALRERTGRAEPYLLTIAAGAGADFLAHTNMAEAARHLDFINLMTYDFHGAWSKHTGHLANLFAPTDSIISGAASVERYLRAGIPAAKLVLGVPFYGRGWRGVHTENQGLYQPYEEAIGGYTYDSLATHYVAHDGFTRHWDETAQAPFLWNADSAIFITYENKRSLARKAAFVRSHKLGGIMYWEQSGDTPQHTLLSTLYESLY